MAVDNAFSLIAAAAFNHIGPGGSAATVAGSLARHVLDVVTGRADRCRAADLGSIRDFTDVRDVACGYLALAESGISGRTYNLCSGRGVAVETVLDHMLVEAGLDWSIVDVVAGPGEITSQVGSPAQINADVSWFARTPVEKSVSDLLTELTASPMKVMKGAT